MKERMMIRRGIYDFSGYDKMLFEFIKEKVNPNIDVVDVIMKRIRTANEQSEAEEIWRWICRK